MILIFNLSIITSIIVLGLTIATQPNMVFYRLRELAEDRYSVIYEPIILCHWCMPTVYSIPAGVVAYFLGELTELSFNLFIIYPMVVMLSSLICGLVWSLYLLIDSATRYYEKK